eukprot:362000-Chlamydomonas_euryale.AAC.6
MQSCGRAGALQCDRWGPRLSCMHAAQTYVDPVHVCPAHTTLVPHADISSYHVDVTAPPDCPDRVPYSTPV